MNAELQRQHADAKARKARIGCLQRAMPVMIVRERIDPPGPIPEPPAPRRSPPLHAAHIAAFRHHRSSIKRPVLQAVSDLADVKISQLVGPAQQTKISRARQVAMYVLTADVGMSLSAVGRLFGRDHSTVYHAKRTVGLRMGTEPAVADLVRRVREATAKPLAAVSFEGSHFE